MPEYDNTNRGVLFINGKRPKDSSPHYRGTINIDGKDYWLSGWNKETSFGDTISLSVQPKEAKSSNTGSGYHKFQQAKQQLQDKVADVPDGEVNLDGVPF